MLPENHSACRFTHALLRLPPASAVNGIRAVDRGAPDIVALRAEHAEYAAALRRAGLSVEILPELEAFPDILFVEDPALFFPECAILLRPGAASRFAEASFLRPALEARFGTVLALQGPGFADGGDVLALRDVVMIGLSARTDRAGAEELVDLLARIGRVGRIVETPPDVLHFKTDCAPLGDSAVLSTRRLAASGVFDGLRILLVPDGEEAAANALRINDSLLLPAGFPRTTAMLRESGVDMVELHTKEAAVLVSGRSCSSVLCRG